MKDEKNKNGYRSPLLGVETLGAEIGFAGSGNEWYRNENNDSNIGWSYSADDESWD